MKKSNKILAIVLSVAMVIAMAAVPSFADDTATVLDGVTLIGSTPCANATAVAPGSSTSPQPIRFAFSTGAETIAADINDYVTISSDAGTVEIDSAVADGNIVTVTPSAALSSSTKYTVDFDQDYLPGVEDFVFTTSKGGTGSGTGGGDAGSQALVLTGSIPTEGATVDASQVMYLTFSTNIKANKVAASNVKAITVTKNNTAVNATVSLVDNWTAKVVVSDLESGDYSLNVATTLTANSGNKLTDPVAIAFKVA